MPAFTTSSFDTLAYVKSLKEADVPEKQAEAQAEALRAALDTQDVATKGDLRELEHRIETRFATVDGSFAKMEGKLTLLHWMLGITLAGVGAIFAKLFLG